MRITNVHERTLPAGGAPAEALINGLAGADDQLWPHDRWPPMRFERGLREGSEGGHGPVRYQVVELSPGRLARFRFTGPPGLIGEHSYELETGDRTVLRHALTARAEGRMRWQWPLLFGPLHDALIEDSLDRASAVVSETPYKPAQWSPRARTLRWLLKGLM
jgi:hypothetical protein